MDALAKKRGGNATLGRELGYRDGAYVGQMIKGLRPITEKTIERAEALQGCAGWFSVPAGTRVAVPVDLDQHPDLTAVRKVKLKLTAGISGYAVEPDEDEGLPIFFRADWLAIRGWKPYDLLALKVKGRSMEPSLHEGDTVVINTADTTPKDGEVFALNYEGESVIKRLVRDAGDWWLASDNADKRAYPNKRWVDGLSFIVGRVVHKQSERI
jgi:phage repressor protein C with HTH and peptisase S24 domain